MTEGQILAEASKVVIQGAFWGPVAFIALYTAIAPWWRSSVGRAIVALDSAIALATGPATMGLIFGAHLASSLFWSWVTVCAFAAIPVIAAWRMVTLWKVQRHGDDDS